MTPIGGVYAAAPLTAPAMRTGFHSAVMRTLPERAFESGNQSLPFAFASRMSVKRTLSEPRAASGLSVLSSRT